MKFVEHFSPLRSAHRRYALAIVVVLLLAASFLVSDAIFKAPYLLPLMIAVAVSTALGWGPALAAFFFAVFITDFLFLSPVWTLSLDGRTLLTAGLYALALLLGRFGPGLLLRNGRDQKLKLLLFGLFGGSGQHTDATGPEFLGRLDGCLEGEIFGWALDQTRLDSAPKITFYVDDRPVGEVLPVYHRPDVGQHCLHFDLTDCCEQEPAARVEAKFPNGHALSNSPMVVNIPSRSKPTHAEAVLFMHIAKTAGTAFREAMLQNYRQSEVAYLYPDPPGFLPINLGLFPLEQRRRVRLVIGHFQYGVHQFFPQEYRYVTIVRNPISRVISHYEYFCECQGGKTDLIEILERSLTVNFDNLMVRCFSGVDEKDAPPGHVDREMYDLAVHNLRKAFSFVGHQERADDAWTQLQHRFGWKGSPTLPVINKTPNGNLEKYESQRKAIEHFNRWDCQLYVEICELFPCAAGNGFSQAVGRG
jgi:Sulfotransferase family